MLVALLQEDGGAEGMAKTDVEALITQFREALRSRGKIPLDEETFADAAALSGCVEVHGPREVRDARVGRARRGAAAGLSAAVRAAQPQRNAQAPSASADPG